MDSCHEVKTAYMMRQIGPVELVPDRPRTGQSVGQSVPLRILSWKTLEAALDGPREPKLNQAFKWQEGQSEYDLQRFNFSNSILCKLFCL